MITQLSIPHAVAYVVGDLLTDAGFVVSSSGGGTIEFERDGEISPEEQGKLIDQMADLVFRFDVYDETEDDMDDEDDVL